MHTVLDDAEMWLLHAIVYQGELRLILAELFAGKKEEGLSVGEHVLEGPAWPLEVQEESRMMVVRFPQSITWQVIGESYTIWDDYEQRDDTSVLQVLSRSRYLDYVHENHGWFTDIEGPANHYRVWTGDEVVNVIACEDPIIEPWKHA